MAFGVAPAAFAAAVADIDRGDIAALTERIDADPGLLSQHAGLTGDHPGAYFAAPRLLWFVAENPIRTGRLPENIAAVATALIGRSRAHGVDDLPTVASDTLALVASGRVARECGVQIPLIEALVAGGADPAAGVRPALGHREVEAAAALRRLGAPMTLLYAAGMGEEAALTEHTPTADRAALAEALMAAALNDRGAAIGILVAAGADPDRLGQPGFHAHATPLHQAAWFGAVTAIEALLRCGARTDIRDPTHQATPLGWARHAGQDAAAKILAAHG